MAIHESDMSEAVKSYVDALQRDRDILVAALQWIADGDVPTWVHELASDTLAKVEDE